MFTLLNKSCRAGGIVGKSAYRIGYVLLAFLLVIVCAPLLLSWRAAAKTDASWAWPGMEFNIGIGDKVGSCSVGFPAWDRAGKRYFITAGHCFRTASGSHYVDSKGYGLDIFAPSNLNRPVGYERLHTIPDDGWYDDVSLVQMYDGRELSGDGWEHIPDDPTVAHGSAAACLVGYKHAKSNCGKVTDTNHVITEHGYPWKSHVVETSYCGHHGDSGGAVYNEYGALGINIAGYDDHNEPGTPGECISYYVPIGKALSIFRKAIPSLTM